MAKSAAAMVTVGKGAELAVSGHTARDGAQPVYPSGGLLSRGHPLGGTGPAQIAEIVWQLRGEAGPRQVQRHRIGVVETMGGGAPALESAHMEGQVRHATFAGGGGDAREEIVALDDDARTYTYRYLDGPLDLASYTSTIRVEPDGDGSQVTWNAEFAAGDPAAEPALAEAIAGIYASGLAELARRFDG